MRLSDFKQQWHFRRKKKEVSTNAGSILIISELTHRSMFAQSSFAYEGSRKARKKLVWTAIPPVPWQPHFRGSEAGISKRHPWHTEKCSFLFHYVHNSFKIYICIYLLKQEREVTDTENILCLTHTHTLTFNSRDGLSFHLQCQHPICISVWILAAPPLTSSLSVAWGNSQDDPALKWETWKKLLTPSFRPAQL